MRYVALIAVTVLVLAVGAIAVIVLRSDHRDARAATPAATPAATLSQSTPADTPTSAATRPVVPPATATPLAEAPREPFVTATHCSVTVIAPAWQPFHVIGPGSFDGDIPAPGDYVRDNCTGGVFFRDPTTGAELPSTQIAADGSGEPP